MEVGLFNGFRYIVEPLSLEIGKCVFTLTIIGGCYALVRGKSSEAISKIKYATIGYFLLRMAYVYIEYVDKVVENIKF